METFTTFLQSIFGEYQPVYVIDNATGAVLDSSIDWGYIMAVVVFLVCLYFVLKTIGGLIYEWLR